MIGGHFFCRKLGYTKTSGQNTTYYHGLYPVITTIIFFFPLIVYTLYYIIVTILQCGVIPFPLTLLFNKCFTMLLQTLQTFLMIIQVPFYFAISLMLDIQVVYFILKVDSIISNIPLKDLTSPLTGIGGTMMSKMRPRSSLLELEA